MGRGNWKKKQEEMADDYEKKKWEKKEAEKEND